MTLEPENLVLSLLRDIRREMGDVRSLVIALADQGQRLERRMERIERRMSDLESRMSETRDDIELMLKAELMGRMGHFETRMERQMEELVQRFESGHPAP